MLQIVKYSYSEMLMVFYLNTDYEDFSEGIT